MHSNALKGRVMIKAFFYILGIITLSSYTNISFAYNVYNKAKTNPYSIEVWGEDCPACFHGHVSRGEHKSCPGNEKGCTGHTQITACILVMGGAGYGHNTNELRACSKKVPAHGWVEFVDAPYDVFNHGPQDSMLCFVYDEHGKVLNDGRMKELRGYYNTCNARR